MPCKRTSTLDGNLVKSAAYTHETGSYLSILAATGITTKKTTPIATWKNLSIQIAGVRCVAMIAATKIWLKILRQFCILVQLR